MLMMRPPRSRIAGTTSRDIRMAVKSETSSTKRQTSSSDSWNCAARSRPLWPTLLNRISTGPKAATARAWKSESTAASVQSPDHGQQTFGRVACEVFREAVPSRSITATRAPSSRKRRAVAAPMPWAAPVIATVLPAKRPRSRSWPAPQWKVRPPSTAMAVPVT